MSAVPWTLRRRLLGTVLGFALLFPPAFGDQSQPIPRIGVLVRLASTPFEEGVRDGLRELGYSEGKNIIIEWRRSAGGDEQFSLAADLARSKVDAIVAGNTGAALAALKTTATIPVVFVSGDPVAAGLAKSLAKPGRNGTGVSVVSTELFPKRLEYLHWLVPRARRIAFLINSTNPILPPQLEATRKAAPVVGVELVTLDARNEAELGAALRALRRSAVDGVIVSGDALFRSNKSKVVQALRESRLPAIFPYPDYRDEVLMCYGPNLNEVGRKLAGYVDRILKGAKPVDMPIEQISKYEFIINLRIARELGLQVPQDLLLRADEVIR